MPDAIPSPVLDQPDPSGQHDAATSPQANAVSVPPRTRGGRTGWADRAGKAGEAAKRAVDESLKRLQSAASREDDEDGIEDTPAGDAEPHAPERPRSTDRRNPHQPPRNHGQDTGRTGETPDLPPESDDGGAPAKGLSALDLRTAKRFGFTDEDITSLGSLDPDARARFLERLHGAQDQIAKQLGDLGRSAGQARVQGNGQGVQQPYQAAATPDSATQPHGQGPVQRPDIAPQYAHDPHDQAQFVKDFAEDFGEQAASKLYQRVIAPAQQLQSTLNIVLQYLGGQRQAQRYERLDAWIAKQDDYRTLFGSGDYDSIGEAERSFRDSFAEAFDQIETGAQLSGQTVSFDILADYALRRVLNEKGKSPVALARENLLDDLRRRKSHASTSRPNGFVPSAGPQRAAAAVGRKLAEINAKYGEVA